MPSDMPRSITISAAVPALVFDPLICWMWRMIAIADGFVILIWPTRMGRLVVLIQY